MRHWRVFWTSLCGGFLLLSPNLADADELSGSRFELSETAHSIEVTLDRGHALLRVRRSVANPGPKSDQALLRMELPEGAVATALRTRGKDRWFEGELLEAEAAAARYQELTGIGGAYPKDPALLSWRDQRELLLQVFPVPGRGTLTFEYELSIPMIYQEGRYHLELSGLTLAERPATVTVRAARTGDRVQLAGLPLASTDRFVLTSGHEDEPAELTLEPRDLPRLDGELAVVSTRGGQFVTHLSATAAPLLSRTPRGAHLVVLIDASRSLPEDAVDVSRAAARAVLSHFRDAKVQILTFDRELHPQTRGFIDRDAADRRLATLELERRNGSHLDLALEAADRVLAATPPQTPRRVLLFTDLLTRQGLTPARVAPLLRRSEALLQVALIGSGDPEVMREDDHDWSETVAGTGGLVWLADASADESDEATLRARYEELARPIALDYFELHTPGIDALDLTDEMDGVDGRLNEGEGVEWLGLAERTLPYLSVSGLLWNEPLVRMIRPDEAAGDRWAALTFGSELLDELSEEEMMVLALRGGAVSPVTSYLAVEPGVRPSTEGLDWAGEGVGMGGLGLRGVGTGGCGVGQAALFFDHRAWLQERLAPAWSSCKGKGSVRVVVEVTLDEIVELTAASPTDQPEAVACLLEAAWGLELSSDFGAEHAAWSVPLTALAPDDAGLAPDPKTASTPR